MSYLMYDLKINGLRNPLGIDTPYPSISWKLSSDENGCMQKNYRIMVSLGEVVVWDTGLVDSQQTCFICYGGTALESRKKYAICVHSVSMAGEEVIEHGCFETALMHVDDWKAEWIKPEQEPAFHEPPRSIRDRKSIPLEEVKVQPANYVRKEFRIKGKVKQARMYITAHGVYTARMNGERVGDVILAPGSTSYNAYLEYQSYDITDLLCEGENALLVCVADGWYVGKHGMIGRSCPFGDTTAVLFQIELDYSDGSSETIGSDHSCKCHRSEIDYADLFIGQRQDMRKYPTGCELPCFDDSGWADVETEKYGVKNLHAQYGDPVRVVQIRRPERIYLSSKNEWILDVGQVLAGRIRMRVNGNAGDTIVLEHAETVDNEGCFFNNIRGFFTHQTDTFILSGKGKEEFCPEYTFHGFRYVRISGFPGTPSIQDFEIEVIASDLTRTGFFKCSNPDLNQLQHNIYWSQKSNLLSVPTDCPQREKSGWTGDAQIFAPTACFNADTLEFYRRWLISMRADQQSDGQIPVVIPYIEAYHPNGFFFYDTHTSAAWGDCAVLLPWTLYQAFGDLSILNENYEMMRRWVGYIRHTAENELPKELDPATLSPEEKERQKYLWNTHMHFGDWLAPSVSIDPVTGGINLSLSAFKTMDIVPTCYYAGSVRTIARVAEELGKTDDALAYKELFGKIRKAFAEEYIGENGLIRKRLQGVYVLALHMGLLEGETAKAHAAELVKMIRENGGALDTGFVSVPYLLNVLCEYGYEKVASELMLRDECPSWLYMVRRGANSMWESWQAIKPDGTITDVSYNHYALGCVGTWMYRTLGGLSMDLPGYKRQLFDPHPMCGLTQASAKLETVHGLSAIEWKLRDGKIISNITIPANTTGRYIAHGHRTYIDGRDEGVLEEIILEAGHHNIEVQL